MLEEEKSGPATPGHLHRVQSLTDAALAHLNVERLLDELLLRVRELLTVDTAAVLLLDESKRELIATAAKGIESEVEQGVRLPVGRGFAGTIAARGEPVILEDVDHTKVLNPLLLRRGIKSMLGVPLVVSGEVIGVLHVGTLTKRAFSPQDVELLQLVADRAALAVTTRRHDEELLIAERLQRSLLPDRFPRVQGFEISGLYVPAGGGMVGGDWYDVFSLPSGSICVVVGDTVGSGLDAAIAMARLRDAVRALTFVAGTPARAMTHLNDLVRHFDPGLMATCFLAFIGSDGAVQFTSAGHLPPLIVGRDGTSWVEDPQEPALGAAYHTYSHANFELPRDSSLLVFTDGLVERRGASIEDGLERLRAAVSQPWESLEVLSTRVLGVESLLDRLRDDLALVELRYAPSEDQREVRASFSADPRELASLRQVLRRWFAENAIGSQDGADLLLAIGEAASNAIEHAYGPGRGTVRVHVRLEEDAVLVEVTDEGRWRDPRGSDRGRGRSLISSAMDEAQWQIEPGGTTVRMRKVLHGD